MSLRPHPYVAPRVTPLDRTGVVWVKRDDATHALCGGNKVRKLAYIFARAMERGAHHIVTVGAYGSHHALATAMFGDALGVHVTLALFPQPVTDHVQRVRTQLARTRAHVLECASIAHAFVAARAVVGPKTFWVPPGGSSKDGVRGYIDAAREIADQLSDVEGSVRIVVACGSGGTAAGLALGFARLGCRHLRVVAVAVARPPWLVACSTRALVARSAASSKEAISAQRLLAFDAHEVGRGYGHPTPSGEHAMRIAGAQGLALDPTYTAKAYAAALRYAREGVQVVYVHTLSSTQTAMDACR